MGIRIRTDKDALLDWAIERYDQNAIDSDTHALGLEVDGEIYAVALYNAFTDMSCNIHIVSNGGKRWASRTFLSEAFVYPFVQLGLTRLTALVPSKNHNALTLDIRLGFQIEGRMREAMTDDDVVVLGMLRRDCIWIPEENRHGRG